MNGIKSFLKSWIHWGILSIAFGAGILFRQYPEARLTFWYLTKVDPYYQDLSLWKLFVVNYIVLMFAYGAFLVITETGKAFLLTDGKKKQ